jgi:hypothetical protein
MNMNKVRFSGILIWQRFVAWLTLFCAQSNYKHSVELKLPFGELPFLGKW